MFFEGGDTMSHVLSADVFSPSYWLVMARVMEISIKKVLAVKHIEEYSVPDGVLADAKNFFVLVKSHIDNSAENLLAALNAYVIARHALPDCAQEEVTKKLRNFTDFVALLDHPRELTDGEYVVAKHLGKFFSQLAVIGSNVACIERTHGNSWWQTEGRKTYFAYFHDLCPL